MAADPVALVTGATGAVGPRLVHALLGRGYRVRVLCLDRPSPGLFPADVDAHVGDITDPDLARSVSAGVRLVFHLAARLHITDADQQQSPEYERVNTTGTEVMVQEALRAGVARFVFTSTITVYGSRLREAASEESPPNPDTAYARTKHAAERIVLQARRADGQPLGVVLRLAAVYGSRMKGNYRSLAEALARHRFVPLGKGENVRSLVYDRDAAAAAVLAAEHSDAPGKVFNVSDGRTHALAQIIDAMCRALGRTPPRFAVPLAGARLAAGLLEAGGALLGFRPPVTQAAIDKYAENAPVVSERIRRELGFTSAYDLRAGWNEAISEMRSRGEL